MKGRTTPAFTCLLPYCKGWTQAAEGGEGEAGRGLKIRRRNKRKGEEQAGAEAVAKEPAANGNVGFTPAS